LYNEEENILLDHKKLLNEINFPSENNNFIFDGFELFLNSKNNLKK
jgi:hypothetical protein